MWDWLSNAFSSKPEPSTGALLDTRSADERQGDIHFGEIVAGAAPVEWKPKDISKLRTFPDFDQASSYACVAFTMAKILGIMRYLKDGTFVTFSPGDIYDRRTNKNTGDGEGMVGTDAYAISAEGVTLDALVPSQGLNEAKLNALTFPSYAREVGSLFKLSNPKAINLTPGDIEAVASVIQQTGKGVMVWFYFTSKEWSQLVPTVIETGMQPGDAKALHHSVTAVDYLIFNGQKALAIEDSAHFGGLTRRIITEEFFKARNIFAAYPMNLQLQTVAPASVPAHTFTKTLSFIPWNTAANQPSDIFLNNLQSADVTVLQAALQSKDFFPQNAACTGYYGALTAKAVYDWQTARKVGPQAELDQLQGRTFGPASIEVINQELCT